MYSRAQGVVIPKWQQELQASKDGKVEKVTPYSVGAVKRIQPVAIVYGDENGVRKETLVFVVGTTVYDFYTRQVFHPKLAPKIIAMLAAEDSKENPEAVNIPDNGVNI